MAQSFSDEDAKVVVGKNVERFRTMKKLSKYALAKAADATTIQITRIERGDHGPGPGLFSRLAAALNVSTEDLLSPQ